MTAVDDLPYFAGRPGAVFFPPALSGEIEMLNTSLLMLNFSPLPDDYAAYNFFKNKLVVGRCSESIIYYDRRGNYYALADRINLRSRKEVENFAAMLALLRRLCEANP